MQKQKENNLFPILFVLIVVVAIIGGGVVFFKPEAGPTAFAPSLISPTGKQIQTTISVSAGEDKVVQVNSAVTLEAIIPSNARITYFSWEIVSPSGTKETKFGRKISFTPKETGNYIATFSFSKKSSDKDTVVITALSKAEYSKFAQDLKIAQTDEKTSKVAAGALNKAPNVRILLIYPNPAIEDGTIRFLAYAFDPDGKVTSYAWKVNDNLISTKKSFTALKIVPGTYEFILTVKDNKGGVSEIAETVEVLPIDETKEIPLGSEGISLWEVD